MDYPEKFEPKESILGHGSFGKVYLVQRTHDKKKFAIKKVPMISEDGADNYQKFVKEAIISSMIEDIKHSSTLDITVIGNDYALIMNYYPLTLARLVYEGKASIGQLNHHYRQLVSVVNYLHENGVAHRDLKLENICLDLNGGIKVIDFGNAVLFNAPGPALCIDVCGTDQYIAPEVLQSKVYDAKLCDTWSLGIIYLVMVTLKLPWPLACITQSSFTDYVRDREMFIKRYIDWPSSNLSKNIVLSMLNPDPSKRITTDALLEEDFFLDRYL
ncbi:kinase-like protein [Neoconidiobolus thromboides FSU 785]|nr:kinase-like protein [Neoconidiobolus thromboides FSU 785]